MRRKGGYPSIAVSSYCWSNLFCMLAEDHIPTSQLLQAALRDAPTEKATAAWFVARLRRRSFGMIMLLLGLVAMLPGVSIVAALLLLPLGYQMIRAHETLVLPALIAARSLPTQRIVWLLNLTIPAMRALEKIIRPRWQTPFRATKRLVGFVVVLLAATLFTPIPLSNVIPGALTILIAFAYLEEDGILLSMALTASLASLVLTVMVIWAGLSGADFLLRL